MFSTLMVWWKILWTLILYWPWRIQISETLPYRGGVKVKAILLYTVGKTNFTFFKNGQFMKMGYTVGKTKKMTSEHQNSWFRLARVNDLCMVQIDPEVSLGVPWHVPRDCSDYHVKKFCSYTLGVRLRYLVFPVKFALTGKTRYLSRTPKVSDQNFLT